MCHSSTKNSAGLARLHGQLCMQHISHQQKNFPLNTVCTEFAHPCLEKSQIQVDNDIALFSMKELSQNFFVGCKESSVLFHLSNNSRDFINKDHSSLDFISAVHMYLFHIHLSPFISFKGTYKKHNRDQFGEFVC